MDFLKHKLFTMKTKKLFTITLLWIILCNIAKAQLPGFNWAHSSAETIREMTIDSNNNIYYINGNSIVKKAPAGNIIWTANLGYSPSLLTINENGNLAFFYLSNSTTFHIVEYSLGGVMLNDYIQNVTSGSITMSFNPLSMCTDTLNNYYVAGYMQLGTSNTQLNGIPISSSTLPISIVLKFNSLGVFQNTVFESYPTFGLSGPVMKIKQNSLGTVYLAATSFEVGNNSTKKLRLQSINNTSLNQLLSLSSPTLYLHFGYFSIDFDFDSNNNIIIITDFKYTGGPYTFGPSTITSTNNMDIAILKFDLNGNKMAAINFGNADNERGYAIEIDASNNIYISGFYGFANSGTVIGGQFIASQGNGDTFLAKLNSSFALQWIKPFATYGVEHLNEIEIDGLGNIIVAGSFNSGTFEVETESFTNQGGDDGFMVKYCTGTSVNISTLPKACINVASVPLSGGTPAGGVYSGAGISSNALNPAIVGLGTFGVTYTYTDANGCKNFDIDSITVYPQPTVSLTTFPDRCVNASNFTLSGGFPSGGTYTGTGVTSNVFSPSTAGVGTYPITYTYTNSNGCFNSAIQNQTVNALPSITFTPLPSLCQGTSTFNLNGALPSGGSYSGNGVVSNVFYPSATGVGVGTHNITYTYQDPNGCVNTASQPITVTPLPTATFITNHETYVGACDGAITANIANGTGFINTIWTNSSATVIGFTNALSGLCPGVYTLTLTDSVGCSKTYNITVNAGPLPPAVPICLVTVDDFSNHNVIIWEKPISTQIDSFRIYRETTTNVFTHIGSVHYDSLSLYHDYNANPNVTSYRYKIASVDPVGNLSPLSTAHKTIHLIINNGGSQQNLQWNDYEGSPIQYYQVWRDDLGNNVWTALSSTIPAGGGTVTWSDLNPSPNPNSRYYLDVIWTNSCEATRTTINTTRSNIKGKSVMIGIDEAELNTLIHLFPNPANNQITIKLPALEKETYIMITNQIGQTVISSQTSNQSEVIAIEQLAKGIYTVTIKTEHGTIHRKLIKQ